MVQIKSNMLNPADTISIINFMATYKKAGNSNVIHEGAAK